MKVKPEPLIAIIAGILVLCFPKLIQYVVGISLILMGLSQMMSRR